MLVSVNVEKNTVTVVGSSVTTVPISQFRRIRSLLAGKTVQYVNEVIVTSGDEVIEMLEEMAGDPSFDPPTAIHSKTPSDGHMWLYATGSGYMNIPDAKMKFDGPSDFKLIGSTIPADAFERMPILQVLLDKGKLGLASTQEKSKLLAIHARKTAAMEAKRLMNSDGTSLIVDTSGGRIVDKKSGLGEEFETITSDDPDDDFLPEALKLAMTEGWGKDEEPDEEPNDENPEDIVFG